jgi:hypothetical protein
VSVRCSVSGAARLGEQVGAAELAGRAPGRVRNSQQLTDESCGLIDSRSANILAERGSENLCSCVSWPLYWRSSGPVDQAVVERGVGIAWP